MSKKVISAADFISAYKTALAAGETNEQLADRLGIKVGSLSVKLTDYRNRLREQGMTDDQVKRVLPSLKRPTITRRGSVDDVLAALVAETDFNEPATT